VEGGDGGGAVSRFSNRHALADFNFGHFSRLTVEATAYNRGSAHHPETIIEKR
jgi:hypothetical protein